jgi:hypothetical protein
MTARVWLPMVETFDVPLAQVRVAFPLRGRLVTSGIGVEDFEGRTAYFWTRRGQAILDRLAARRVTIDPAARRPREVWRAYFRRPQKRS